MADLVHGRATEELVVRGLEYPPGLKNKLASSLVGLLQMFLFALILTGDQIFAFLRIPKPAALDEMQANKMSSVVVVWFAGSMLQTMLLQVGLKWVRVLTEGELMLVQTRAFEIYKGNTLIWSSLNAGRTPTFKDIVNAFEAQGVNFIMSRQMFH